MKIEAVFIDRDGVINKKAAEHDYIKNWDEFEFLDKAIAGLRLLRSLGIKTLIVTNQRGIGRQMMTEQDLKDIHERMQKELRENSADLNGIYYCPHGHEDNCDCRKPMPGMIKSGLETFKLNPKNCLMIDDSKDGIEAGARAGVTTILISPDEQKPTDWHYLPDYVRKDLFSAAKLIESML